jgi:mRNA-degrading endonuclease RelE of RelBE toxin-antitoxin system
MKSKTTDRFWKRYDELPAEIKKQAREAYRLFQENPYYPSMHFKRIHSTRPIFSVRISKNYRAVGIVQANEIIWFWVGSHSEYDKLVKSMRSA